MARRILRPLTRYRRQKFVTIKHRSLADESERFRRFLFVAEVLGKKVERSLVGVDRGGLVVGVGSCVAVETVLGVGVAHDLGRYCETIGYAAQFLDLFRRDALVEVAVEAEPRAFEFRGQFDERREAETSGRESTTVETGRGPDGAQGRGVERHRPAHAETHDRDVGRVEAERGEEVRRCVEVVRDALFGEVAHQGHRLLEVVVGHLGRAVAMEELGGHREITLIAQSVSDTADVIVDAEGLLDHDDGSL